MSEQNKLNLLSDVPVEISAVLGTANLTIGRLLAMEPGAVLELDREISDDLDICINGSVVAKGELMIENGRLGIMVTHILEDKENQCG